MQLLKSITRGGASKASSTKLSVSAIDADAMAAAILKGVSQSAGDMAAEQAGLSALVRKWVADEVRYLAQLPVTPAASQRFAAEQSSKVASFVRFASDVLAAVVTPAVITTAKSGELATLFLDMPVFALHRDLRGLVQGLVEQGVRRHAEGAEAQLGGAMAQALARRLCAVAGLSDQEARAKPHRLRWPAESDREGERLVRDYLGGTVLAELLLSVVRVPVTDRARQENMLILGGSGAGKSQLIGSLLAAELARPKGQEVGIVIIDSTDLAPRVARLKMFANNDRLLLVDPSDVEWPIAANLFDLGGVPLSAFPPREREQMINTTVDLYEFVVGGLLGDGSGMTQKQSVVFRFLIRLMLMIGGNIHTLREVLEEPHRFVGYMEQMSGVGRHFFLNEFLDRQFNDTRKQILRRLYGVLENSTFERMFASSGNKLDFHSWLNSGRVIVCNTSREFLGNEMSRVFGRYCIAVAVKAAFDRARIPIENRRMSFIVIDEASDYFSESIGLLLAQAARKFKLSAILAHQSLDQLSDSLRALVLANTSVKFASGVSAKDARSLSSDMRCSPEFILNNQKSVSSACFAAMVRNVTPTAVSYSFPLGTLEAMPRMSDDEYDEFLTRNRSEVSAGGIVLGGEGDAVASSSRRVATDDFGEAWD